LSAALEIMSEFDQARVSPCVITDTRRAHLHLLLLPVALFLLAVGSTFAAVRFVDEHSANPTPPFTSWTTAARVIQDAVDVAAAGDEVVVTNGVYATGGRAIDGLTNRVAVDKPLTLRSVNGPQLTIIQGYQVPGTVNGDSAIRCVYLTDGAILSGFTLTNGATRVFGDYYRAQGGGGVYLTSTNSVVTNCVLTRNRAEVYGGAACGPYGGLLSHCVLIENRADYGGGTYGLALNNCVLFGNEATYHGGGVWGGALTNCTVCGNTCYFGSGGGASDASMVNSIIYFNNGPSGVSNYWAARDVAYCCTAPARGGVANITLDPLLVDLASGNLRLQANSPCVDVGLDAAVIEMTDLDSQPRTVGAAVDLGAYEFQWFGPPVAPYILEQPSSQNVGIGSNVTFRVVARGTPPLSYQWRYEETALPGETNAQLTLPNVQLEQSGRYSVQVTNVTGAVTSSPALLSVRGPAVHYVNVSSANPTPPYTNWETAAQTLQDAADATVPGAEIIVTNGVYSIGGRAVNGTTTNRVAVDRAITVRSVNGPQSTIIQGYQVSGTANGDTAVRGVYLATGARLVGFTVRNGATGNLSTRPDNSGGGVLCESSNAIVSSCILTGNSALWGGGAAQGTFTNCVFYGNQANYGGGCYGSIALNSLLATNLAISDGGGGFDSAMADCLLLRNMSGDSGGGAYWGSLSNCVLNGNTANYYGGGAMGSTLQNCTVTNNSAGDGGGLSYSSSYNCLIAYNWATDNGGGAYAGSLYNCTLVSNSATNFGGGGYGFDSFHIHANCILYNSIIYSNLARLSPDCQCTQYDSCISAADQGFGANNINDPPQFVNAAAGDFRLSPASPCINAGNSVWAQGVTDLDGNPRIANDAVDMGAYEFQGTPLTPLQVWLQSYGLPTDGSVDYADSDKDGMNNWQEWHCNTNPTNALSVLRLLSAASTGPAVTVTWQSVSGLPYFLERSTNLSVTPAFTLLATNVVGEVNTTSFADTNVTGFTPLLYRVGIGN
jgi:hypothetical protein